MKNAPLTVAIFFLLASMLSAQSENQFPDCNTDHELFLSKINRIYKYDLDQKSIEHTIIVPSQMGELGYLKTENPRFVLTQGGDSLYYYYDEQFVYSGYRTGASGFVHIGSGTKGTYLLGENLYYFHGRGFPIKIKDNAQPTVADIVVDQREFAYYLSGENLPMTEKLMVVDSFGTTLAEIPFEEPVNTQNGYGMFTKGGKIYVAFGSGNPNYPNSYVPIEANPSANTVSFGERVSSSFMVGPIDLASCSKMITSPYFRLINKVQEANPSELKFFPNPVADVLSITSNQEKIYQVEVWDLMGKKHKTYANNSLSINLELTALPPGMYLVVVKMETGTFNRKVVVE